MLITYKNRLVILIAIVDTCIVVLTGLWEHDLQIFQFIVVCFCKSVVIENAIYEIRSVIRNVPEYNAAEIHLSIM